MSPLVSTFSRVITVMAVSGVLLVTFFSIVVIGTFLYMSPTLPRIDDLSQVRLTVPLRVMSADNQLIAEFGEKRRSPLTFDQIPEKLRYAFISSEDDRFFHHVGFDYQGLVRASLVLVTTGRRGQGGSTITMQLARNLFLTSRKTFARKIKEIFLAMKIERELTKKQILELYLNKIYLGNRSYGVQAAAHVYYGKDVGELSIAQMAMIAGLPKAPSRYNPIVRPKRALIRRNYVLRRMHQLGHIDDVQFKNATKEAVTSSLHALSPGVEAPYVAEMVRQEMKDRYGTLAYEEGYTVYTTIKAVHQKAANDALRKTLLEYDRRHGYKKVIDNRSVDEKTSDEEKDKIVEDYKDVGHLRIGLITAVADKAVTVYLEYGVDIEILWDGLKWARKYIDDDHMGPEPKTAGEILKVGDVIYIEPIAGGEWKLAQVPEVAGAMVSINPKNGAITSLVGGFDFYHSKFNRVVQAKRQPGSNFKPFIYSGALDKGFTPATLFNDTHVTLDNAALEKAWRPENYERKVFGPTRMRVALTKSRNLVAIRILKTIGISYAVEYAKKFGFSEAQLKHSRNLTLALGSLSVTPLQLASGYSTFANGGYRVVPYFIRKITKDKGSVIFQAEPGQACLPCERNPANFPKVKLAPRIISQQVAFQMTSMLRDVIQRGTGTRAYKALKRNDLSGKTGTTNEQKDAWFSGYSPYLVATAWVGFDKVRSLGRREYGGRAALPMWIKLMRVVLKDKKVVYPKMPPSMVTVKIDPKSGLLANNAHSKAIDETFRESLVPKETSQNMGGETNDQDPNSATSGRQTGTSNPDEEQPLF